MITLIILALLLFTAYTFYVYGKLGIPDSYSNTWYLLKAKKKGLQWIWYGFMITFVALLLPAVIELTPDEWRFLAFLAVAPLGFVGTAAAFKDDPMTGKVHLIAAIISAAAIIGLTFVFQLFGILIIVGVVELLIALIYYLKTKQNVFTFNLEQAVFITGLGIYLYRAITLL